MEIESNVRRVLAQTWQVHPDEIPADAALGSYAAWDSLGHVGLMLALAGEFGFDLDAQRVRELTNLPSICTFIAQTRCEPAESHV